MKIHKIIDISDQFVAPNERNIEEPEELFNIKKSIFFQKKVDVMFVFIARSNQFSTKPRPTHVS